MDWANLAQPYFVATLLQFQDLDYKSDSRLKDSFNPKTTVTSEESGVNESGLGGFPGASVSVGRTGQTGGGTNPQNIPPEEGGDGRHRRREMPRPDVDRESDGPGDR